MIFEKLPLEGLVLITPEIFNDARGYFFESYNKDAFFKNGIDIDFAQDNQSLSFKNALRGLHFQNPPYEQGKLVRVICGSVNDVVVDIRKTSPDYGKHFSIILSSKENKMLWIPPGFAHGFATLEDNTIFSYKCTKVYNKESESGIIFNDESLGIDWSITNPVISDKDMELKKMSQADIRF
ncbi:MAG TPA: dTDP-4-dehydrorhamnose 3,5-epimerase [Bacteroidia bacterium]|nr:dTDP-4-dehydrorhamnose 3,5-epimerase [Bacteroidia bacterium]HNU33737.1 dTDP-4-dehydrorhamnose 3,5-epimerase [Bacteroidia bacterium]